MISCFNSSQRLLRRYFALSSLCCCRTRTLLRRSLIASWRISRRSWATGSRTWAQTNTLLVLNTHWQVTHSVMLYSCAMQHHNMTWKSCPQKQMCQGSQLTWHWCLAHSALAIHMNILVLCTQPLHSTLALNPWIQRFSHHSHLVHTLLWSACHQEGLVKFCWCIKMRKAL